MPPCLDAREAYTGRFEDSQRDQIVVTLDKKIQKPYSTEGQPWMQNITLRVGFLDDITGAITRSLAVKIEGSGYTIEENETIVGEWQAKSNDAFSVPPEPTKAIGVRVRSINYKRVKDRPCHLLKLPLELRRMIWDYSLHESEYDRFFKCMERRRRAPALQDTIAQSPIVNRISEICKFVKDDAHYRELAVNIFFAGPTHTSILMSMLRRSEPVLKNERRMIFFSPNWGPDYDPDRAVLHNLLSFAKAHDRVSIRVHLRQWKLRGELRNDIREYIKFGIWLASGSQRGPLRSRVVCQGGGAQVEAGQG
ncbi:hypothetical protein NX059_003606 [Plenodomus lindquistii]|nr:hypothetical protein NX059_003606 [Plenodomus lindquistii]